MTKDDEHAWDFEEREDEQSEERRRGDQPRRGPEQREGRNRARDDHEQGADRRRPRRADTDGRREQARATEGRQERPSEAQRPPSREGQRSATHEGQQPPRDAYCTNCGESISPRAEICPECGVRQHSTPQSGSEKNAGLALVLSFFYSGLGQFYNGEVGKGIAFFVVQLINVVLMAFVIGLFTYPLVWIIGMYDAYNSAKEINREQAM